jgi:hypothetical protein
LVLQLTRFSILLSAHGLYRDLVGHDGSTL